MAALPCRIVHVTLLTAAALQGVADQGPAVPSHMISVRMPQVPHVSAGSAAAMLQLLEFTTGGLAVVHQQPQL